tara:strand:+ start:975 stop:1151 length:177 start_codon:yes stop_codon:yes gene_type:complete
MKSGRFALFQLECRGQDLNLRTVEDWDLIPAPLTKLGDPCSNFATLRVYIKTLGYGCG